MGGLHESVCIHQTDGNTYGEGYLELCLVYIGTIPENQNFFFQAEKLFWSGSPDSVC